MGEGSGQGRVSSAIEIWDEYEYWRKGNDTVVLRRWRSDKEPEDVVVS